jgi:hypothetical protein
VTAESATRHPRRWGQPTTRWTLSACVLAALGCLGLALWNGEPGGLLAPDEAQVLSATSLPVASWEPNASGYSSPAGSVVTFGLPLLFNRGDRDLVVREVSPDANASGLRYKGAYVAGLSRTIGNIQMLDHFPPVDPELGTVEPAVGALLPATPEGAERGIELLLGFGVTGEARAVMHSLTVVVSEVDGSNPRTLRIPSALAVCAQAKGLPCKAPRHS